MVKALSSDASPPSVAQLAALLAKVAADGALLAVNAAEQSRIVQDQIRDLQRRLDRLEGKRD
jgi:hypothetical protein